MSLKNSLSAAALSGALLTSGCSGSVDMYAQGNSSSAEGGSSEGGAGGSSSTSSSYEGGAGGETGDGGEAGTGGEAGAGGADFCTLIHDLNVVPNVFNPSAETATVSFTLDAQANVQATIDQQGQAIRVLLDMTNQQPGAKSLIWDGKTTGGVIVQDGVYTAEVIAYSPACVDIKSVTVVIAQ